MKIISFYLPQFHPIPENDVWWGKGFTEWKNVVKARPRYRGHYQPHIPADLGFYDLRLEETRIEQAKLARENGIYGFCYYHYWFSGKMLLERPFEEVLQSGKPNFPFCLCWANESWTKAWDGRDSDILMKQSYTAEDRIEHINWLCSAFKDPRYIRIDDKPLFLIYRTDTITDLKQRIADWRKIAKENGFAGLYLCSVRSNFEQAGEKELIEMGFDAIVDFAPNVKFLPRMSLYARSKLIISTLINKLIRILKLEPSIRLLNENAVYSYRKLVERTTNQHPPDDYVKFPCVAPSWDNSARRRTAIIIQNDDPKVFGKWLENAFEKVANYREEEKIVFVNAWNEWAEGCHLEPDERHGRIFLEAIKKTVLKFTGQESKRGLEADA